MNAFPPSATAHPSGPSRDDLVASSAGWLAVSLNLGGQGAGYIYQRRWRAFWIGGLTAFGTGFALAIGAVLLVNNPTLSGRLLGQQDNTELTAGAVVVGAYTGVLAVSIGSAVEAGLAVNRARRRLGR